MTCMEKIVLPHIFFFDLHRVSESLRAPTNPGGAQALGKEFPASAPRLIQVLPSPMALRNCLHPVGFELETLKGSKPQGSSQLPPGQPLRVCTAPYITPWKVQHPLNI